ncbi:TRAP transporter small permease [Marinomonas sp. 15G1-11]|uniref:TRAP transporter small permease protein n=1 Tax=Marinomonas phaeophyticola TaxID=3004091 RepID=A0ABT4JUJ6_9GAMM|nr:TRAP transporter small permease [Marinomonas sp. 15G1-11]MCZ2722015.1 TRAP transporter small permease [Marinomonas sp. 15G1-11]
MRKFLNNMYLASGYLSGFCILLITLLIVSQVIGRLFGFIVPSVEDFSGYSLAAATFFGLAYTFREGGHIRVSLAIKFLPASSRRIQELFILAVALLLCAFMSFYTIHLSWESYIFEEVSYGYIPVPIWLPQVPVALGMVMFTIAIADDFFCTLLGQTPNYLKHEDELDVESGLGGDN